MSRRRGARVVLISVLLAAGLAQAQETTSSSVLQGVYTEAQAKRGAEGYAQSCASCHGQTLGGVGEAPALEGLQFVSDFNGLTLGELFDRIRTTMPQSAPGSLSRTQYADILAFILKSNGYPAGSKELDHRSEYLAVIRFEAPP